MVDRLLEPKRSDEQYSLHLSPYPSLCLHAGHPLPPLPYSIPAKKLQEQGSIRVIPSHPSLSIALREKESPSPQ